MTPSESRRPRRLPAALLVALLLPACGQTGPLHLPEDAPAKENYLLKKRRETPAPSPAETPAPAATPATAPAPSPAPSAQP